MQPFTVSEGVAANRRFYVKCVDKIDGITPEDNEGAGQPQISVLGEAYINTTNTLVFLQQGMYYVELTASELDAVGTFAVQYLNSGVTAVFDGLGRVKASPSTISLDEINAKLENTRLLLKAIQWEIQKLKKATQDVFFNPL